MTDKDALFDGAVELTDEQLEGIAGGVVSPVLQGMLRNVIDSYKSNGKTLDDLLADAPAFLADPKNAALIAAVSKGATLEEVQDFVVQNW